jgi:predicted ATPase
MQGFPDQAIFSARTTLEEARATDHALSLCTVLAHAACPTALYAGDLAAADQWVTMLMEQSAKLPLTLWDRLGRCLKGALLLARGDVAGLMMLRTALDQLRQAGFGYYDAAFLGTLAQGMAKAGQTVEASAAIDQAIERCEQGEGRWCFPELLRIKGEVLRLGGTPVAIKAAEDHFLQALEWARRQDVLSWELRAATSLAELWLEHGSVADAEQLLSSVYNKFGEGFETSDLRTARGLLAEFRKGSADH